MGNLLPGVRALDEIGEMSNYTASDIQILNAEQVCQRWFWAEAGMLATQYKRPEEWIKRGLLACEEAGVPHDYFVDRYLRGMRIDRHSGVDTAMRELLKSERFEHES